MACEGEITLDRRRGRTSCENLNDRPRVGNVRSARQSRRWHERAEEAPTIAVGMRDAEDGASRAPEGKARITVRKRQLRRLGPTRRVCQAWALGRQYGATKIPQASPDRGL